MTDGNAKCNVHQAFRCSGGNVLNKTTKTVSSVYFYFSF